MMNRRAFLAAHLAVGRLAAAGPRPNVLFLAADDMNTSLGCYGHPLVQSPHVDGLARSGVRFDRAYCQFPLCGPSRASLLTGLRPDSTGVLRNNLDFRQNLPDHVTLPQLFKQSGYHAVRIGKMFHMNVPGGVGTDQYQDPASWSLSLSPQGTEHKSVGTGANPTPHLPDGNAFHWIQTATAEGQADYDAAQRAIALLEEKRSEPFFLAVGFVRPHVPFVAPSRFYDLYPLERITPARNPANDLDDIPPIATRVQAERWRHAGMNEMQQKEAIRGYYASTSFMDDQLGRVLGAARKMGLLENTIVAFWGDHGYHLGEHTRWAKMTLMEPAARVPLIVSAPRRAGRGKASSALVEFVDLYPTLAELCGLTPPPNLEGQSLVPLLDKPDHRWKKAAFTQLTAGQTSGRAIRTERYRYIRWDGTPPAEELYDHRSDPGEFANLAGDARHKGALAAHRAALEAGWRAARAGS